MKFGENYLLARFLNPERLTFNVPLYAVTSQHVQATESGSGLIFNVFKFVLVQSPPNIILRTINRSPYALGFGFGSNKFITRLALTQLPNKI